MEFEQSVCDRLKSLVTEDARPLVATLYLLNSALARLFFLKQSIFACRRGTGNHCIRLINTWHAKHSQPNCFEQYVPQALLFTSKE